MFSVDKYLVKTHCMKTYNCWDFIREVWLELKNEDIGHRTPDTTDRESLKRKFSREEQDFLKLEQPENPCIVLFKRKKVLPHVGILYNNRVLHLPENNQGKYEPLGTASLGFTEVGYYKCK